jgi:hypothetical protein
MGRYVHICIFLSAYKNYLHTYLYIRVLHCTSKADPSREFAMKIMDKYHIKKENKVTMYEYMYIYIYIHIYIYVYIYIYIYMYIYICPIFSVLRLHLLNEQYP